MWNFVLKMMSLQPDDGHIKKHMEAKVQKKMQQKMELLRLGAETARMNDEAEVFGQVQASHTETIDRLLQDSLAMQQAMGMLDESARRAAMAAHNGAKNAIAQQPAAPAEDFTKEREMLKKLIEDLKKTQDDLKTTDNEWRMKTNSLDQQLIPILPLERVVNHEIMLDLLPKKADLIEFEKALMQLGDHVSRIVELEGAGLPPELLEALRMLKGMEGLKGLVKEHGNNIAKIFSEWATQEDMGAMEGTMQDLDAKTQAEIDKEVDALMAKMAGQGADWQRNLNSLGESINGTYRPWMSELEAAIRAEIEKLKSRGQGVSAAVLEQKLAELRAKMEGMSAGGESGSAAFRCIACDRVLPDNNTWNPPPQRQGAGRSAHPNPKINPASTGNRKKLSVAAPTSERIYKAGFPMTNPKIKPQNRKMDHSRTFGRNMRPTLALGPGPGGPGGQSQQNASGASLQQWDMVKDDGPSGSSGSIDMSGSAAYARQQQRPGTSEGLPSVYNDNVAPRAVATSSSAPNFPGAMLDGQVSNHAAAPWPGSSSVFDQHARADQGGGLLLSGPDGQPRTAGAVV